MSLPGTALLSLACLGTLISQAALATGSAAWNYEATLYLHAAPMEGDVGVRGVTGAVDASFSDIRDHLDMGFMGM